VGLPTRITDERREDDRTCSGRVHIGEIGARTERLAPPRRVPYRPGLEQRRPLGQVEYRNPAPANGCECSRAEDDQSNRKPTMRSATGTMALSTASTSLARVVATTTRIE
jgi:hypothetical protein